MRPTFCEINPLRSPPKTDFAPVSRPVSAKILKLIKVPSFSSSCGAFSLLKNKAIRPFVNNLIKFREVRRSDEKKKGGKGVNQRVVLNSFICDRPSEKFEIKCVTVTDERLRRVKGPRPTFQLADHYDV